MGAVIILAPVVVASWPAIAAAVTAAAAGLGLTAAAQGVKESLHENAKVEEKDLAVEVDLSKNQTLSQNMAAGKEMVVTKDGVKIKVKSDARGRCVVSATGRGKTKTELEGMASEFAGKITQAYVYNKVMNELRGKGFKVANEEVMTDQSIRINVRNEVE
jgi:hypothetical protein